MRFRTVVIAAVVLAVAAAAALAAFTVAEEARAESRQVTVERNDSLAVNTGIVQKLVSDQDHDPTRYDDTVTVINKSNGATWTNGTEYAYYNTTGEIEFLVDRNAQANVTYQYDVPADQAADDQLQTVTEAYGLVLRVGIGLALVVLLLFIAGFTARRLGVFGGSTTRGR